MPPLCITILLIELGKLIEDIVYPDVEVKSLVQAKLVKWIAYVLVTVCRYYFIKRFEDQKEAFLDRTDIVAYIIVAASSVLTNKFSHYSQSADVLWIAKMVIRSFSVTLCVALTFYNWVYFPLTMALFLGMTAWWNLRSTPSETMYWLPTFIALLICSIIIAYVFERHRRSNFERNLLGVGPGLDAIERPILKGIMNTFPHGVLVANRQKQILYANESLFTILHIPSSLKPQSMDQLESFLDFNITTSRSSDEDHDPRSPDRDTFVSLKENLWSKWDTLARYFSTAPLTDYLFFKGKLERTETRPSKALEVKIYIRELAGEEAIVFTFLDVPDILVLNMLSQAFNRRLVQDEDAISSESDRTPIKDLENILPEHSNRGSQILAIPTDHEIHHVPYDSGKAQAIQRKRSASEETKSECKCPQILVADDDPFVILSFESIFSSMSYTYQSCYNGQQVIDEITKRVEAPCCSFCKPFRIIFLDTRMPIMDGYQCFTRLQEIFKKYPTFRCPVVFLETSFDSTKKKDIKGDAVCKKPVAKGDVERLLRDYVETDARTQLNTSCI